MLPFYFILNIVHSSGTFAIGIKWIPVMEKIQKRTLRGPLYTSICIVYKDGDWTLLGLTIGSHQDEER